MAVTDGVDGLGKETCDDLDGLHKIYTCCDECKAEGRAVVKCFADIFGCNQTNFDDDASGAFMPSSSLMVAGFLSPSLLLTLASM